MLRKLGEIFFQISRKIVPDPFVLAVLLTIITSFICLFLTPMKPVELLQIWTGQGSHLLLRKSQGEFHPWVVTEVRSIKEKQVRLKIWRRTAPENVARLLRDKLKVPVEVTKRNLIVTGWDAKKLMEQLSQLRVRAQSQGLWHFLAFAMQMCLILLTGYALAMRLPVMKLFR